MSAHEQIADLLDGAAEVIERDGWHQGGYTDGQAVCLAGAINVARSGSVHYEEEADPLNAAASARIAALVGVAYPALGNSSIADWNDAPGRTKQEVLDALRLAAKSERRLADGIDQ